jgi:ketosteroid isomerase-like protein
MPDDSLVTAARDFLAEMQACVRAVDFVRARDIFADDVVAFGTFAAVVVGRDALERDQWRNIWPHIREFTFRLGELQVLGSHAQVCAVVPWDSLGVRPDGTTFDRPGRATLVLEPRDTGWVATHSHFSLAPAR